VTVRVDARGKIFTNVVHKDEIAVLIQTLTGQIHGHIYVNPDQRLIDEMNGKAGFLAVTEAEVHAADGSVVHRAAFLTVNKQHIIWLRPDDEADPAELEQQPR
jgi:Family of unknown function (DUF6812)